MSFPVDDRAQHFGLPRSMLVPIAARSVEDIERYVGVVEQQIVGRQGRVNALAVVPHNWPVIKEATTPLWRHEKCVEFERRLHPKLQIWVYVDYRAYRNAYLRLSREPIPESFVLDHIQNREAIRIREYSHPYLRLCPVSRRVNTSGGTNTGGEGMEKDFLRTSMEGSVSARKKLFAKLDCGVVYADPMDLTKMLDTVPGTQVLGGVGQMLKFFYAE